MLLADVCCWLVLVVGDCSWALLQLVGKCVTVRVVWSARPFSKCLMMDRLALNTSF